MFGSYADFCDRYNPIAVNLQSVAKEHLGVEVVLESPPSLGVDSARKPYEEAKKDVFDTVSLIAGGVRNEFVKAGVGIVDWESDDTCRFGFHDVTRTEGIIWNTVIRDGKRHVLVRARTRRLDDKDVSMPAGAKALVADLLPELQEELRVIVGTQIEKQDGRRESRKELTALGEAGKAALGKAKKPAKPFGLAAGVAALGGGALYLGSLAVGTLGTAAAVAPVAVAVADPALVLGDVVFFGWE